MTIIAANWVGENTSTVGTGPLALSGAISTFCPFSVLPDGSEVYYTLQEGFNRETGIGVVSNGTLTRNVQATLVAGVYTETNIPISLVGNGQVFAVINADFMTRIYNFSIDLADSVAAAAASAQASADYAALANNYETQSARNAENAYLYSQSASDSKIAADESKTAAANSASAAENSQADALASKNAAKTSETNSKNSETSSAQSATNSANSADAALDSKNAAKTSETNSKTSETNAKNSEINAAASQADAANSASAANTAKTGAETAADRADVYAEQAHNSLNSIIGVKTNFEQNSREQWRRSLAVAGITIVDGSFESGATASTTTDAVWHIAGGQCYTWGGTLPKTVPANSTPASTGEIATDAWKSVNNELFDSNKLQRTDPFGDIKADGAVAVSTALANLALGDGSALPVGIPVPWPTSTAPTGWLKCNGATFTAAQYPKLALVYPGLMLPDLRGEFIRGWDDGRNVDSGRVLLSEQSHAFQDHKHLAGYDNAVDRLNSNTRQQGTGNLTSNSSRTSLAALATKSSEWNAASETRPRNIAFNYIVRAA